MPNIASAKKNMRKSRAATVRNRAQRSALRTALKKAKAPDATAEIKLAAARSGISRVEVRDRKLMLTRHGDFILVAGKFPRLVGAKIGQHLGEILELIKKL